MFKSLLTGFSHKETKTAFKKIFISLSSKKSQSFLSNCIPKEFSTDVNILFLKSQSFVIQTLSKLE